jgi:mediator of RNA polymerase II transcription subunit 7
MMQDQLERSKAETEGILRMKAEVERVLESLGKETLIGKEYGGEVPQAVARKDEMEAGKDVWEELRREFR